MGRDASFPMAFYKAQLAEINCLRRAGLSLPKDADKGQAAELGEQLIAAGLSLLATAGAQVLAEAGLAVESVNKVRDGSIHVVDRMKSDDVALIINTTSSQKSLSDSREDS